jgi:hypothetical protein
MRLLDFGGVTMIITKIYIANLGGSFVYQNIVEEWDFVTCITLAYQCFQNKFGGCYVSQTHYVQEC